MKEIRFPKRLIIQNACFVQLPVQNQKNYSIYSHWMIEWSEFLGILIRKNNVVDSFPIDWLTNLFFQL